jgi:hypothetical protein
MKARVVALISLAAAVTLTSVAAAESEAEHGTAIFQRSAQSQSTSPAFTGGASLPSPRLATSEHVEHGWFLSKGRRGTFTIELRFGSSGTRSWRMRSLGPQQPITGQYAQITGGGARFPAGGHQAAWYARLFGRVSRPGAAKQRVLITLKGKPTGVFVLTPLEPGVLMRDSGTQRSFETG